MTSKLSAEEMKQYDRQLRLWGVNAQMRMLNSKVLVVGLRGIGAEICKNLVLAGIGSLTIMDHQKVELRDLGSQFFLSEGDVGKNRAQCSLEGLKTLNPNVKIIVDSRNIADCDREFLQEYNVVCLSDHTPSVQIKVNSMCRSSEQNIYFFSVETFGWYAYFHQDLREHEYTIKKQGEEGKESSSHKLKVSSESLDSIYKVPWSAMTKIYGKRLVSSARLFCAFQVIHTFREEKGRLPTSDDMKECLDIRNKKSADNSMDSEWLPERTLGGAVSVCGCALNPVCAIFGGLIGSEILKVISGQDKPWENTLVFDGQLSQAVPRNIK